MHCLQHLALPFTLVYETDIEKPLVVVPIGRPQPTGTTAASPMQTDHIRKKQLFLIRQPYGYQIKVK
ncbi:hypothetical protein GCM10011379_39600 [Filimonas zeae]|uniref:Uncharacterized protein n=1 Tax=Filimonas zeae TaxID=1737353 RepID=A0A917J407_9BACT|nr:hypothetical protein GCM10011379_39600 [Filimonas zeae]